MRNKPNKVKKKKGMKISVADIITIVLIFTIWVLLFILLCKIFEEPQFKITKEECENKTISVIGNDYGGKGDWIYYFNPPANATHCSRVEVDEIEIWDDPTNGVSPLNCSTLNIGAELSLNNDGFFCKDGIVQKLNVILKQDLTIKWLEENCECSFAPIPSRETDYLFDIENCIEFKCGDYIMEKLK